MNEEIENINEKIPVKYTLHSRRISTFYIHQLFYSPRKLSWVKGTIYDNEIHYNILTGNYFLFSSFGDEDITSFYIDEVEINGNYKGRTIRVLYQKGNAESYTFFSLPGYSQIPKLLKDYILSIPEKLSKAGYIPEGTYSQDAIEETVSFLEKTL